MTHEKVLEIVLREMVAYGKTYRADWSDFDGRHLKSQLDALAAWAKDAVVERVDYDYGNGTLFLNETLE